MNFPLYQQIRSRFGLGPASHMTHLNNLPAIITAGELCSYSQMRGRTYQNIANEDVQAGRAAKTVPPTNRPLHDFVPLYFGFKTPMVAVNKDKNEELVFLRFSLEILTTPGVVITDGNARSNVTKFRSYTQIDDLSIVDAKAVNIVKYAHDGELKRKKQAEILVPDKLPFSQVFDIICFSEAARTKALAILDGFGINKPVYVNPGWYFSGAAGAR